MSIKIAHPHDPRPPEARHPVPRHHARCSATPRGLRDAVRRARRAPSRQAHRQGGRHRGARLHPRRRGRARARRRLRAGPQARQAAVRDDRRRTTTLEYGTDRVEIHVDAIRRGRARAARRRPDRDRRHRARGARPDRARRRRAWWAARSSSTCPTSAAAARLRERGVAVHSLCEFEGAVEQRCASTARPHAHDLARGDDGRSVEIIDQTRLPHAFETRRLATARRRRARDPRRCRCAARR